MKQITSLIIARINSKTILPSLMATGVIAIAVSPLFSKTAAAQVTPDTCQTVISDPDGDGWGWEHGASCIVASDYPVAEYNWCNGANADPDGDGWGWENNATCIVPLTTGLTETATPACTSNTSDSDGDGRGWEDGQSCASTDTNANTDTTQTSSTGMQGILCDYVDSTHNSSASVNAISNSAWTCSDTSRILTANGIPDHAVGTFPNAANPNSITEQAVAATFSLSPIKSDAATRLGGPAGTTGYVLNGVKIDAGTGGSCDYSGENCSLGSNVRSWSIAALGQSHFDFGTDEN